MAAEGEEPSRLAYYPARMWRARLAGASAALLLAACVGFVPLLWAEASYFTASVLMLVTFLVCLVAAQMSGEAGLAFEYRTRYRFRRVCEAKGLATKDHRGRWVYPRLTRLAGGDTLILGRIRPHLGQSVADWERAAAAFEAALQLPGVRFQDAGDGWFSMRAGYAPLGAEQFRRQERAASGDPDWSAELTAIHVAATEGGQPYLLPLLGTHTLICGVTGAGKGSVLWSLILRLEFAIRAGVVRLWACDPKRLELAQGRALFGDRYASSEEDILKLLDRAVSEMEMLADQLAGVARKATPSPATPVNIIFIDELAVLSSLVKSRDTGKRIDTAIKRLLYLGRALNFIVIGAIQDPRKDNVDYREAFPVKVAMKLEKPMVDLVLGSGSHEAGALCDMIPHGKAGAGVAFVKQEGSSVPVCVRFPWCSDELIRTTAGELAPVVEQYRLNG